MDMRDKFELLAAAMTTTLMGEAYTAEELKSWRDGKGYGGKGVLTGMWIGFMLAAAAIKRGDDIQ